MTRTARDKEELLQAIARLDPVFQQKMREGSVLERKFDRMIGELDDAIVFADDYEQRKKQAEEIARGLSHI